MRKPVYPHKLLYTQALTAALMRLTGRTSLKRSTSPWRPPSPKPKDDGSGEWEKDRDLSGSPFIYDERVLTRPAFKLERSTLVDLNTASRNDIERLDLPTELARQIAAEDKDIPFNGAADFLARMKARYNALSRPVDFEEKYWPLIVEKVDQGKATF